MTFYANELDNIYSRFNEVFSIPCDLRLRARVQLAIIGLGMKAERSKKSQRPDDIREFIAALRKVTEFLDAAKGLPNRSH